MAYKRVNWENLPSTKTPVNADNLNKMDKELGLTDKSLKYNGQVPTDWNDAKTFGVYHVSGSGYSNAIHGGGLYGILIVYESLGGTWTPVADGGSWIWQEFRDTAGNIYKRYAVNGANTWSPWDNTVWTDATKTSAIGGTVKYTKIGNIVIVIFDDVNIRSNIDNGTLLASGLPTSISSQRTVLNNQEEPSKPMRVAINESGQIVSHYTTLSSSSNNYYGTLIYITN